MPEARKLCGENCLGFLRDEGIFWPGGDCLCCVCLVHLQAERSSCLCMLCLPQQDCPALSGALCDADTPGVVRGTSNST